MSSAVWAPIINPMKKTVISALSAGHLMAHLAVTAETTEVAPL
jgi:hypothetical protein